MLSLLILLQNLKWMVPTTFMIGAAPVYISIWGTWRLLSSVLPRWVFVKGDDFMFSTYHRNVLFCFETLTGTELVFYGDLDAVKELENGENTLYLSNHQSTVDWVIASSISFRRGCLGRTRYVLKDGLRFLPLYGFYLGMHGSLFVKRGGKFEREKSAKKLLADVKDKVPMWMVLFPEGTRYNPDHPEVIKSSQNFAVEQGVTALQNVLYPKLGATQVCVEGLQTTLDCVFDVTVAYSSTVRAGQPRAPAPTMQDFLMGATPKVHIYVRRIPIQDVPRDQQGLKHWLYNLNLEKDKLLTHFYSAPSAEEAKFPGESTRRPLPLLSLLPSVVLWSGTFALAVSIKESRSLYWKVAAGASAAGILWMGVRH